MAAKTAAAEKKPPVYEVSPKWILIYQVLNFVIGIAAFGLSFQHKNPIPLAIYFMLLFFVIFHQFLNYSDGKVGDIQSKIYHPDLLPFKEFVKLKKRYLKAEDKVCCYEFKGKRVPTKYQEIYDNLKAIIDAQNELRIVCWFKMLIGEPKPFVSENVNHSNAQKEALNGDVENVPEETTKNVNPEAVVESDSDDESESDISTSEDESDSEFESSTSDSGGTDVSVINGKKGAKSRNNVNKLNGNAEMKTDLENLKAQFAEIKSENAKLKNFGETFIESQAIF